MHFNLNHIIKRVEGLDELMAPFTMDEIDLVVKEMPVDRAPGPDGFNGCFLKSCCFFIKHEFNIIVMVFY